MRRQPRGSRFKVRGFRSGKGIKPFTFYLLPLAILLLFPFLGSAQSLNLSGGGGGSGVVTASDCSSYTALGQLCQDTDDGKLYKGTGSAVEEVGTADNITTTDRDSTLGTSYKLYCGPTTPNGLCTVSALFAKYLVPGGTSNIQTWTGNFSFGATLSGNTSVTFPTTGKLVSLNGTMTDEQLLCGENTGGVDQVKSCGAKTTGFDTVTTGNFIVKAGDTSIGNPTLAIDAHAGSTTITLYPGICPIIHNTSQEDDVAAGGTLPAVADGKCFMGLVVTAKDDETFRLVAASVNTVCLDGTCGKDDIGFATTKVVKGSFFTCVGQGTEWFCETGRGTVNAGDL